MDGDVVYEPIQFAELTGWQDDDHRAAFVAFRNSIAVLNERFAVAPDGILRAQPFAGPGDASRSSSGPGVTPGIITLGAVAPGALAAEGRWARDFFENCFQPHRIRTSRPAFFTGYFEPVLKGSRRRSSRYHVPLLRPPDDLETLVDDTLRAACCEALTHAKRTSGGITPLPVRAEIEQGSLDGAGLELLYLDDPVAAFVLHVQGSGLIELDDGTRVRVGYAGKNGHPYTSIGRWLIDRGLLRAEELTLQSLMAWLKSQPNDGQDVRWQNQSYIFFEERGPAEGCATTGARGIVLTPGRSLAVDASIHALGLPVFIDVPGLDEASGFYGGPGGLVEGAEPVAEAAGLKGRAGGFRRLMIAQDVGSAIRGAGRGDIFFGSGMRAGHLAGLTKHTGDMIVLLPVDAGAPGQ